MPFEGGFCRILILAVAVAVHVVNINLFKEKVEFFSLNHKKIRLQALKNHISKLFLDCYLNQTVT